MIQQNLETHVFSKAWIQEAMKNFGPFDRRYFALSSLSAEVISLADCTLEDLHFAINALKVDPKALRRASSDGIRVRVR